jgi:VWFA-related protein
MRGLFPRTLIPILWLFCLPAFSQQPGAPQQTEVKAFTVNPCAWLPNNIPHAEAVTGVCQYAMSLPEKMPNFICEQDASRFRGKNKVPFDLVTASVRYEDGKESFDEVKVNGQPGATALTQRPGLWSTGEFGSNLRSIFDPQNQALFTFVRETSSGERAAWVFSYRIVKQNNPLWRLHGGNAVVAPPYQGELWVDQKTGELLRFGSVATDIPKTFPTAAAELQIDYADVPFADGSSFVLPADFTVTTSLRGQEAMRNLVQFRNCHKFRAKSRMVLNVPAGAASGEASTEEEASSAESPELQLEKNEKIYAILREQAVREDAARLEAESRAELAAATAAELSKLNALEKERQKDMAEPVAVANDVPPPANSAPLPAANAPPLATNAPLTTLRVSVKLVPVTVVLRDSKGNATGNLRKEDFQLFDNGKPQEITSFSVEKSGAAAETGRPGLGKSAPSPGAAFVGPSQPPGALRSVAYVFDDIHAAFGDLVQARDAALRHIAALRPDDRAAMFTTSGEIGLDFTADREKLQRALKGLRQHPPVKGSLCPPMSEYMADLIVNQFDLDALGAATKDAINCAFGGMANSPAEKERAEQVAKSTAREVLSAGSAANQSTINVLQQVVRRTAATPGNRSIVLVSPGFLTLTPETRQSVMELVDNAIRANIVVHTLDVRGLTIVAASGNETHPANPVLKLGLDRDEALAQSDVMAALAYGTGGTFFHNNNDVNEGFRRTADAPEYMYVLGFSPQKLDGKFHKLKVRLNGPEKLTIQVRQGYYAVKPQ